MADTWNAGATTFQSILMNVTNGAAGNPVGAAASELISLQTNATERFGVRCPHFSLGTDATPFLNLSDIWNTSATVTGIKYNVTNTASNAASLLMDLGTGGGSYVSRFKVGQDGTTTVGALLTPFINFNTVGTTTLIADAANTLAQRNGANAQTFRFYNTFTDASNYERFNVTWFSNSLFLQTASGGTGVQRDITIAPGSGLLNITAAIKFSTANTYDIGASGASTPRAGYFGSNIWSGAVTAALTTLTGAVDGFRSAAANVTQLGSENTTSSSATQGGFVGMYSNDGAAMASGDRLGGIRMGGSSSASALRNSTLIAGFADQNWVDASAYGSRLEFQTTTNGATTLSTKAILSNAGIFALGATVANTVPALKPSSTTLQIRLADDSDFTNVQGKLTTDANAVTGLTPGALAALTTATMVIYDATGTAYRVPCVTP